MVQFSTICDYWKTIALTVQTFVGKVMSLLFDMLSRFVIAFLPRNKHLLISWLQSSSAVIWEPEKIKPVTAFAYSCPVRCEVIGQDAMILFFWILSFKSSFSLSSFTFIKRVFSSSSLSSIRVVSSAYLRLLIYLRAVLIQVCDLTSSIFHMLFCVYKLNKLGDNILPRCTPSPILNQSVVPCLVLNCCFLACIQVSQETDKLVWYSHLLKNFLQFFVIHTVKDFNVVNEVCCN